MGKGRAGMGLPLLPPDPVLPVGPRVKIAGADLRKSIGLVRQFRIGLPYTLS